MVPVDVYTVKCSIGCFFYPRNSPVSLLLVKDNQGLWGPPAENVSDLEERVFYESVVRTFREEVGIPKLPIAIDNIATSIQVDEENKTARRRFVIAGRILMNKQDLPSSEWKINDPDGKEITQAGLIGTSRIYDILMDRKVRRPEYNEALLFSFLVASLAINETPNDIIKEITTKVARRIEITREQRIIMGSTGVQFFFPSNPNPRYFINT